MNFSRFLCVTASLAALAPAGVMAQDAASADTRPITRAELPALVEETLMNNPEIIMKAAQKVREKQLAEAKKQTNESLAKHKEALFADTTSPRVNDQGADITVIEFFDYHCGYCKQMTKSIQKLVQEDKKVRVIFREFPILSEDSVTASRAALAAYNIAKDKYFDFHLELMETKGKFDEKTVMAAAKKVGINSEKLKAEMGSESITAQLNQTRDLAEALGIRGTPALIVGEELVPGAMPYPDLVKLIEKLRKGEKPDVAG